MAGSLSNNFIIRTIVSYLEVGSNSLVTFLTLVGEESLVTLNTERPLISEDVPAPSQGVVAVETRQNGPFNYHLLHFSKVGGFCLATNSDRTEQYMNLIRHLGISKK